MRAQSEINLAAGRIVILVASLLVFGFATLTSGWAGELIQTSMLKAVEATQAAAADDENVYAISSTGIAKYDRKTGSRISTSTGPARHLNSGFLREGRLYCAHSNYPAKPEKSEVMVLDTNSMALTVFKDFGEYRGSLTWVVHEGREWWCTFAHYGKENAKTVLVKLDENWKELGAWTYPPEVVAKMGNYSISGGVWRNSFLLVTGHDERLVFKLRVPAEGNVLEYVENLRSPFPGQGIANDPKTGGLVGINRDQGAVVFAEFKE